MVRHFEYRHCLVYHQRRSIKYIKIIMYIYIYILIYFSIVSIVSTLKEHFILHFYHVHFFVPYLLIRTSDELPNKILHEKINRK